MEQSAPLAEPSPVRARADSPYGGTLSVPDFSVTPPWHVRHAKALLCAAGLVVVSGVGSAFYYVERLRAHPLAGVRVPPSGDPLPLRTVSVAAPAAPKSGAEAAIDRRPANPPQQAVARIERSDPAQAAPRMALPVPPTAASEVSTGAAKPMVTSSIPAITHTRRSEPVLAAPTNERAAPRRSGCTDAAEVLGLCEGK